MPENRSRYVVLCQQALVLGTVAALAAPALGVATLDIVSPHEAGVAAAAPGAAAGHAHGSLVASAPVRSTVTEFAVHGIDKAGLQALTNGRTAQPNGGSGLRLSAGESLDEPGNGQSLAALTAPEPVTGYATVGVTWQAGERVDDNDITVSVRSLKDGTWSGWEEIEYHDEHAPDPGTEEARKARPGTDPIVVGDVDEVQVKAETSDGEVPDGMQLAVVDPGETAGTVVEQPAIDTARLGPADTAALSAADVAAGVDPNAPEAIDSTDSTDGTDTGVLSAAADVTPKPLIYSRAQWGADERMRDKSSLHYYEIHAGFVHHTVNANRYSRRQVPALLRGIYAYHTQSKGWSDIGYNFIVDRFGRIWEGRYGGVARPVVGAHTLNYNENSFAMSALGNFEKARPSSAMLDAYGRLFAWKLSLHGIDASSTRQWVGSRYFQAINGHRDAGQTACPGRYLYAQIPTIRTLAAKYQRPFTSRAKNSDISGTPWPDLVVRDADTQHAYVVHTAGQLAFEDGRRAARAWKRMDLLTLSRDLTGDGVPDMVGRVRATKETGVYPGTPQGTFASAPVSTTTALSGADQLVAVGDLTGDGENDLVARNAASKDLYLFAGGGRGGFAPPRLLATGWEAYTLTAAAGNMIGDGRDDLVARDRDNRLWLFPGQGNRLGTPVALPGRWRPFDLISGMGDVTNDGRPDLVAHARRSGLTYIYPGDGQGGFGHRFGAFSEFKKATFLGSAGQLAGNGQGDLVARVGARLVVFANTGNTNLGGVADTGSVFADTDLVLSVGDWNGDGHSDVMTRSASRGRMYFRAGDGAGHFAAPVQAARGGRRWGHIRLIAAVGDVTGDGFPDLMGQRGRAMRIYPGNGATGFRGSYVSHSAIAADAQAGSGLWNADGSPDSILRRTDGSLVFYPGNGPGGLMNPTRIGGGARRYDWIQGVGDADGDGFADLVVRQRRSGDLWLLPGNGSGFDPRRYIGSGFDRFDLG